MFTLLELKKTQPVMYWTDSDSRWESSEATCESKGGLLCLASELCSPESDPFGAYLYGLRRTPVRDGFWLNIGVYHWRERERGRSGALSIAYLYF